ncbi:hypothetical protein V9T40_013315 [Parthenolecanium corni]|uniref:Glutathione S-transferase n=1 Tax=Parthenolecanium corni TaxID=536013 RepID=A0AAN9TNI3_9HEMI
MVLKFYYDLASPPVRAVYFTIKNLDIPVELVNVSLAENQIKSEAYLKINPLGTVPCIDDDGFVLLDSHAINIYLTTKYPQGEKLYPSDPKKRAVINERLFFETCELFGVIKVAFTFMPVNKDKFPQLSAYLERAVTWPFYAEVNEDGHKQFLAIWETKNIAIPNHAINIYLTTKYPQGEKFYPSDPKKRAIVNERLFFEACDLFSLTKTIAKKFFMQEMTEIDEATVKSFENGYNGLEIYLKKSKYIAGDNITIADFSVLATVTSMKIFVPVDKEKFPLLTAYLKDAVTWPFYTEVNAAGHNKMLEFWKTKNVTLPNYE